MSGVRVETSAFIDAAENDINENMGSDSVLF